MRFNTRAFSSPGSRSINEDALSYCSGADGGAWVVADGLGGHACGEQASKTVVDYLAEQVCKKLPATPEECLALIEGANDALVEKQKRQSACAGMRTTVVAAFVANGELQPINVGDSRFYYFSSGKLVYQTKDHSMSQVAVDLGEITPQEIRFHEDRNALTKVLGFDEPLALKRLPERIPLQPGDAFMLCSDGFWEYVLESEMEDALAADTGAWLDAMLKKHAARVEETGKAQTNDNYTAVCCMLSDD